MAHIGIVWRGDAAAATVGVESNARLRPLINAFAARGIEVSPVVYRDEIAAEVERQLARMDAALVWVDPISGDTDRVVLDGVLQRVAEHGVIVSTHPDVIARIGTKEVLHETRHLSWSADVHRYDDAGDLRREFPDRLAADGPRVLKQRRGNGGIGVWKVEQIARDAGTVRVAVQHAQVREIEVEEIDLDELMARCDPYFADGGCVIDQKFQPRVAEGIVRVYLVGSRVVGFAHQGPGTLADQPGAADRIMGLPSPKTMFPPDADQFAALRSLVEAEWVPALPAAVGVSASSLPVLWDADFLLGPKGHDGSDSYVLCEINVSCVTPFPPEAVEAVVDETLTRLAFR